METGALRQLLNNLCTNSQWCYAVFWKLQQLENHKILTCEEVYYDSEKPQQPCQSILNDTYTTQEAVTSFSFGTNDVLCDVHSFGNPIAFAVANTSCCQYLLGEGLVGRVALAENDFWIYSDNIESTEVISNLGYGDEWFLPIISAGIKTTLLASVLPYGVLHLGSFEKVAENLVISADIKDRFYTLNSTTISSSSNYDNNLLHSILMSGSENTDESGFWYSSSLQRMEYEDPNIIHTPEFIQNNDLHFPTAYDQLVPFMDNGNNIDMKDSSFFIDDQDYVYHPNFEMANVESDTVPNELITANHKSQEAEMWIYELQEAFEPDFSRDFDELQQEALFESVFPKDLELQETIIKTNNDRHLYEENAYSNVGFNSLEMEMCGSLVDDGGDKELLMENVDSATTTTATNNNSVDADTSYQCHSSMSSVTSLTVHATCCNATNSESQGKCNTESTFAKCLPSPPSLESLESAIAQHEQPPYEKKSKTEAMPSNWGKEKPRNKSKPRPRDRQLIQDRLKELRNLIPDSEKCSIDGLLDQTMKHMKFLKSVTERAEKVKHFIGEEVDSTTKCQKNSHPSFGLDSNYDACPIIMKDLEHPSQFLIQMACSDEGVFFEIAEVLHKLNLTILKGVMENRRNKWACFIVEASKGFNRLDIFWPMMRILRQNGNWMVTD